MCQMCGQGSDDLDDVGQLFVPVLRRCLTELVCLFKQLVEQRLAIFLRIEDSIFRCATRRFDDRRNQITN